VEQRALDLEAADALVVPAVGLAPQPVQDGQLVLQQVGPLLDGREGEAELRVLLLVPTGPDADLDATTAHLIHRRDDLGEDARMAEGHRRHEHAQADALRVAGETGQDGPGVGRGLARLPGEAREVVGPEPGIEAVRFRALGGRQLIGVGHPLLGFHHQDVAHRSSRSRRWSILTG
jgi:hypothetical protein